MRRPAVIRTCPVCRRQVKVGSRVHRHLDKAANECPMSGHVYRVEVSA